MATIPSHVHMHVLGLALTNMIDKHCHRQGFISMQNRWVLLSGME